MKRLLKPPKKMADCQNLNSKLHLIAASCRANRKLQEPVSISGNFLLYSLLAIPGSQPRPRLRKIQIGWCCTAQPKASASPILAEEYSCRAPLVSQLLSTLQSDFAVPRSLPAVIDYLACLKGTAIAMGRSTILAA